MNFNKRVKLVAPFWLLSACYFLIPFIRDQIQPPALFIDIDNAIPFIWPITCKAVLVFFATFLAKQHFIADGIAGLFLGFAGYQMRKKYFLRD